MPNFYCKHCGNKFPTVFELTRGFCHRNPDGSKKHELYEGSEKNEYVCKYCGNKFPTLIAMSYGFCHRDPRGKKKHSPAL